MYAQRQRHTAPSIRTDSSRYAPSSRSMQHGAGPDRQADVGPDAFFSDFGQAMFHTAGAQLDGDPLKDAEAVHSLDPKVDGQLEVRTEEDVAAASRAETADWNTPFLALDADPKLGFTFSTAGPEADPSMAVRMGKPGERRRGKEGDYIEQTGIETLADYRAMLVQDFNFGGLVERLAGVPSLDGQAPKAMRAAGEGAFIQLAIARFHPGLSASDPATETTVAIAKNIWSYATCGYDVEGRSDISELQGLLYLFDAEIRRSSDTNTEMASGTDAQDWFVIPGTEDWETPLKAKRGDGRHGTATVRTTRHLMAKLDGSRLDGFDESFLLLDRTGSMGGDEYQHLSSLLERGGLDGTVALASFEANIAEVSRGTQLTQEQAQTQLKNPRGPLASSGGRECTMKSALAWLQRIKARGGVDAGETVSRQMVIVTDAPDNDFEVSDLEAVQKLAREMNMSIKVMYSYVASAKSAYETDGADTYMLIDIMKIKPDAIGSDWKISRESGLQLDWRRVGQAQGAAPQSW